MKSQSINSRSTSLLSSTVRGVLLAGSVLACLCFSGASMAAGADSAKEQSAKVEQVTNVTTVNINAVDAPTIAKHLKGIGAAKAKAIVAWREKNGQFSSVDQLLAIKGIGKSTLKRNEGRIALAH